MCIQLVISYCRYTLCLTMFLVVTPTGVAQKSASHTDELVVRRAGSATSPEALLTFFRLRSPTAEDQRKIRALIRDLGDTLFATRESASKELATIGPAAAPFLRISSHSPDREIARRASACLLSMKDACDPNAITSAARLLARHNPSGSAEALLAYIPFAEDDEVEQELQVALGAIAGNAGKAEPCILKALSDANTTRRAAAVFALAPFARDHLSSFRKLLTDQSPKVRFQAARSLIRMGEKQAVPVVLDLLVEAPLVTAWQSERILYHLAGIDAPAIGLQGTEDSRRKCRKAWNTWWVANERRIDLANLRWHDRMHHSTMVADLDEGSIVALAPSWKEKWRLDDLEGPVDFELLPSGRVLVAENHAQRITERDQNGNIVWKKDTSWYPLNCSRIPNGNTFIATARGLLEISPDGKIVWTRDWPDGILNARRSRSGQIVILSSKHEFVTFGPSGQKISSMPIDCPYHGSWTCLTLLSNSNFLLASNINNSYVLEMTERGEKVWECHQYSPTSAARMQNGHTLISQSKAHRVVEVDHAGKIIHEYRTKGRPWLIKVSP